jgi:hypothetical protein
MFKRLRPLTIALTIVSFAWFDSTWAQHPPRVTYVSGKGTDTTDCAKPTSPCRTFQFAVDHTDRFGEVKALDPADYGPVKIRRAISITGVEGAGIHIAGDDNVIRVAITIEVSGGDPVNISHLILDGNATAANGIVLETGGDLTITHSTVRNFLGTGIVLKPTVGQFLIADTLVSDNEGGISVDVQSNGKSGGTLDRVVMIRNREVGLGLCCSNQAGTKTFVTAFDTVASHNAKIGFAVQGLSGLVLAHSSASANGEEDFLVNAPGNVGSFGDNYIEGKIVGDGNFARVNTQ